LKTEYEILLMLDPELAEERQEEILVRTRELVERGGGTWDRHEPWGRRKLAYEIAHKDEGVYHLVEFTAEPATLDEASRILKITDGVIRHMAVRRVQRGPGRPLSRPPRDGQDGAQPVPASEEE
jgi:small subunit ribosomal protein S6